MSEKKRNWLVVLLKAIKIVVLALVLFAGVFSGLVACGGIYAVADRIAPMVEGIPWLGERAYPFLENVSKPQTGYERRKAELAEREEYLLIMERALKEERVALESEKKEIEAMKSKAENAKDAGKQTDTIIREENSPFALISAGVFEMSPKKLAAILSNLTLEEAAELLGGMDAEKCSKVLEKMSPVAAAKLIRFVRFQGCPTDTNKQIEP